MFLYLTYCIWILILTITYSLDITKYSLLYSIFIAILINIIYNSFIVKRRLGDYLSILTVEILILLVNIKKHFFIDKKKLISYKDIVFNIVLFLIYNIFLLLIGTNLYKYYFSYKFMNAKFL
tara:strand:- start:745 stop:1110 length:366 start_codon:yes stop_codon:yes gene_type:complete